MSGPHPHIGSNHPATDAIDPVPGKAKLSIWFFCGALALVYGLVLIPAGIYQMSHPPVDGAAPAAPDVLVGRADDDLWRVLHDSLSAGERLSGSAEAGIEE